MLWSNNPNECSCHACASPFWKFGLVRFESHRSHISRHDWTYCACFWIRTRQAQEAHILGHWMPMPFQIWDKARNPNSSSWKFLMPQISDETRSVLIVHPDASVREPIRTWIRHAHAQITIEPYRMYTINICTTEDKHYLCSAWKSLSQSKRKGLARGKRQIRYRETRWTCNSKHYWMHSLEILISMVCGCKRVANTSHKVDNLSGSFKLWALSVDQKVT